MARSHTAAIGQGPLATRRRDYLSLEHHQGHRYLEEPLNSGSLATLTTIYDLEPRVGTIEVMLKSQSCTGSLTVGANRHFDDMKPSLV